MNSQFKRKLIGVAVASCFVGTAYGNPAGPAVVSGSVGFGTSGKTFTVTNSPGAIINWQSFSIAADEATRFIQQSAASSVLNRVVGVDPSAIFGLLQSNGRVFLINPNGLLFGATARIDVPGFVASTLDISNADFLNGRFNFAETPGAGGIDNQGTITTPTGGFVYLVASDVKNSGIITSPQGEVILAAGKSVELVNPGSPDIRVVLTAPDNQAINVGAIVAKSGRIGIYGGLISQQGVVNANTVIRGKNGEIIFKATQDVTLEPGSVTTASGEGRGVKNGGEVRLVADGTLTVAQDAEVHVDGGPNGGDGGFLELSGKQLVLNGEYTGRAQPGYQGGSLLLDPDNIDIVTGGPGFPGASTSTESFFQIDPVNLDYGGFADVTLSADNTLRVLSPISNADVYGGAPGGSLTLNAGNLLLVDAPIGASGSGTRFDHDLNLRSQNDVVVRSSTLMGNRTLKLEADVPTPGSPFMVAGDNIGRVLITAYGGPVTVSTLGDINVNAPVMGVMGGSGSYSSVRVSAGNDINLNLSGSTCLFGECGAFGVIGGTGPGAFAEVTAGNDIKIRATDPSFANVAVWGGGGSGAYAKLRAGNDLVLDLQPANAGFPGGGWLDVFANGGGTNAYAEASAGRDIKSWDLVTNGSGGLDIGSGATTIGGVIVEGGSGSDSPFGLIGSVESNQTATLSAGYTDAGVPTSGSINLDLAYGMEVLGGYASADVDGGEGGTLKTDASALVRAAGDVNISVAGAGLLPSGAAVRIEGGSAFAWVANAYGSGVTTTADMKADATVMAYGGQVSITVANGSIKVGGGSAEASASHYNNGFFIGGGTNKAIAQAKTTISAGTGVTLDAQNGSINIHGGQAVAFAGHSASIEFSPSSLSGNNMATATAGVAITAGATSTVSIHGYGGVEIDAGYGGAIAFHHQSSASNVDMSGDNSASAYGGLAISGGSISITADSGEINVYAPAALAVATNWLDSASGASVNGNNQAYAEFKLSLTASYGGGTGIVIDAGANSVQLGGGSTLWVDELEISLPRGAMALAENNVFSSNYSNSSNSLAGDNMATAKAAMSLTSAGPVTISGYDVNIYGQQIAAMAVNSASGSHFINTSIAGNNTAAASGALMIEGTSVTITANNKLEVLGGGADASAYSLFDASYSGGNSNNTINASAATNLNKAEAYGGVSFNATGGNLTLSAANGGFGSLNINGGGATANAYKDFDNSGSGSGNVIRGDNAAWAGNEMVLKASGDVDIETTGGSGQVSINNNSTNAQAYNTFSGDGYGGAISGAHNATATGGMEISAGATVTIASYGGSVQISGPWRSASAYNSGSSASNFDVSGSNTAQVDAKLKVTGASVSVTAGGSGGLQAYGGAAQANAYTAYSQLSGVSDNLVDITNIARVNEGATEGTLFEATAGDLLFSAANGSVNINGAEGYARAYKKINDSEWSNSAFNNDLLGDNTASVSNKMVLKASGDVDIEATGTGQVYINAYGGMATAQNSLWANSATVADNTLSGNNEATLTGGMDITAGTSGTVTIATYDGGSVGVFAPYVSAEAMNHAEGSGGLTLAGNAIAGNNTATASGALNVTGGSVTVTANGSLNISGGNASADAHSRLNSGGAAGNLINAEAATNLNKAEAYGGVTFNATGTGGLTLSAANGGSGSLNAYGGGANANAYKHLPYGSSNQAYGGNTAWAENKMVLEASGDVDIETTAGSGSVKVTADGGEGRAYAYFGGYGGTISGDHTATATGGMEVSAGGSVTVLSYGGSVSVLARTARGQAYKSGGSATAYNVSGVYTASANNDLNITAGASGDVIITAGGDLSVSAYDSHDNDAYSQIDSGSGNNVSGNNTVAASMVVTVSAGRDVVLTSYGGSVGVKDTHTNDFASAYQSVSSGDNNQISGNNTSSIDNTVKITAGQDILVSAAGSFDLMSAASSAEGVAKAWKRISGTGNTLSDTNSATVTNGASIEATRNIKVTANGNLDVFGREARALASNSGSASNTISGANQAIAENSRKVSAGSLITITSGDVTVNGVSAEAKTNGPGDNQATAKSTATLNAGTLTVESGSLYVNGGSGSFSFGEGSVSGGAFASHEGAGAGAPVADASATVNSAVVNVSGNVSLNGGSAYTFTGGAGAPKADANASILMGAGAKTMTVGGSLNLYGGFTDFTGAGTPSAYALIDPGQLTITTGGDVHLIGGEGVNTFAGLHAFGPIVLNIGGSELELRGGPGSEFGTGYGRSGLFEGTGTGFEPGTGSNITVSFTSGTGTIIVDNTCSFCGDAFVRTEPTALTEFAPPPELFRPQEAPTPPDEDEEDLTLSGSDDGGEQDGASEDDGLPTCT